METSSKSPGQLLNDTAKNELKNATASYGLGEKMQPRCQLGLDRVQELLYDSMEQRR